MKQKGRVEGGNAATPVFLRGNKSIGMGYGNVKTR